MEMADFVIVGSGGGGGTISWLLAKEGFKVVLLEQGGDIARHLDENIARPLSEETGQILEDDNFKYNRIAHDEYRFRLERPDPKRRPRGSYNTFRRADTDQAVPFGGMGGWTGSVLGGGSVLWGTWSFQALPIDFKLRKHFTETKQLAMLENWGYSVPDWPMEYREMEPFYHVAETLLSVCGDRKDVNEGIKKSRWYQELGAK